VNHRLFAIGILFSSCGAYATTADDYAFAWPLQTQGDSAAWQVELTPDVYAAIHSEDLRDIEIVNAAGESVPAAPRAAQMSAASTSEVELPLFTVQLPRDVGPTDDTLHLAIERDVRGRLRRFDVNSERDENAERLNAKQDGGHLILDVSNLNEPIDSLWLSWDESSGDATAQFSVSGSDDLQQWRVLNASASVLAMHQNGNSLSRHQIALNGVRMKYLRLNRLDRGPALPYLHVRARTLGVANLVQPARVWVDARVQPAPAGEQRTPPSFYYQLPAPLAAEALKLELVSDNSLARVSVRSRAHAADANAWATRSEFTAFRLRQNEDMTSNDEMAVAANGRAQDWRIDPVTPLDAAPTLRVAFRPDRFVFLAQGAGPYRLVAGSARTHRGDYPIDAALAQLRGKLGTDWQPPLTVLGARVALQGTAAYTPVAPQIRRDWKTWALWALLIGAAALIGGLALSLLKGREPAAEREP
jgi:hypothetical protein